MKFRETDLPGVLLLEPRIFSDARGRFFESWHQDGYVQAGLPDRFVQDNVSISRRGVLRGLHFQHPRGQGKLLTVLQGEVFDVAVDIRRGSPSCGRWFGCTLSRDNALQLYIPPGFAHGFLVTSDEALVSYKCTDYYDGSTEATIRWNDTEIGIVWPAEVLVISDRDRAAPMLRDLPEERLPVY